MVQSQGCPPSCDTFELSAPPKLFITCHSCQFCCCSRFLLFFLLILFFCSCLFCQKLSSLFLLLFPLSLADCLHDRNHCGKRDFGLLWGIRAVDSSPLPLAGISYDHLTVSLRSSAVRRGVCSNICSRMSLPFLIPQGSSPLHYPLPPPLFPAPPPHLYLNQMLAPHHLTMSHLSILLQIKNNI